MLNRLKQFLDNQDISINNFEKKISASQGTIHKAIQRQSGISSNWLPIIKEKYPSLNMDWLIFGEGEMLKTEKLDGEEPQPLVQEPEDAVTKLIARIESLVAENTRLKIQLEQLQGTKKAAD